MSSVVGEHPSDPNNQYQLLHNGYISTIRHENVTESFRKQFRCGNSFTEITEHNFQNISVWIREVTGHTFYRDQLIPETIRFSNHRAGITENNSKIINRGHKINANFFAQSFSTTLRVMDVRGENRGRPCQKVRFPAAPVVGRNFLAPGNSGVRVRNVRRKSGPKSLCLCCFGFPE